MFVDQVPQICIAILKTIHVPIHINQKGLEMRLVALSMPYVSTSESSFCAHVDKL